MRNQRRTCATRGVCARPPIAARLYAATVGPEAKPDAGEDEFIDGWRDRFGPRRAGGRGGRR